MRCRSPLFLLAVAAAIALGGTPAGAADLPSSPAPAMAVDPLQDARQAVQRKDWRGAEQRLRAVLAQQPRLADGHNLLGYSLRQQGRYDEALAAYAKVFEIDPKHLGAHEYAGEAYVKLGRLADAERHLSTLQQLCARCEETQDLAASLARARTPARPASAP